MKSNNIYYWEGFINGIYERYQKFEGEFITDLDLSISIRENKQKTGFIVSFNFVDEITSGEEADIFNDIPPQPSEHIYTTEKLHLKWSTPLDIIITLVEEQLSEITEIGNNLKF